MPNVATITPLNQFFDTNGSPLNSGYLFFGSPNQDPEEFPVQMFWDAAGAVPALQPIRTISGYPSRAGSPAIIYGPDSYSLRVRNSASVQVLYAPELGGLATSASLAAPTGSSLVGFIQAGTGAVATTALAKMRETISAFDFMTTAEITDVQAGTTLLDVTTALQTAITAAAGKALYLPTGVYKISTFLNVLGNNTHVYGDGHSTKILTSNATTSIFVLGDDVSEIRGIIFEDLAIDSSVNKTDGYAFHGRMIARSTFRNIFLTRPEELTSPPRLFNGYYFDRFDYCSVLGGNVITKNNGISCRGNADQSFGAGLFIDDGVKISGNLAATSIGVLVGGAAGGVTLGAVDVIQCNTAVAITTTLQAGIANREVFMASSCTLDSSGERNLFVAPSSITHLTLSGTWIASAGATTVANGQGIAVDSPNANLVMIADGVRMYNNRGGGYLLSAGDFTIVGGTCHLNGITGTGFSGIKINNTLVTALRLSGVKVDNNGSGGVGYGLETISGAPSTGLSIDGCSFLGNAQGSVLHTDSFTTSQLAKDNLGFVTENSGTATIVNGQAGIVVNHGIDPSRSVRVIASPLTINPEAGTWYVANITSATFTIFLNVVASRDNHFTWKAEAF